MKEKNLYAKRHKFCLYDETNICKSPKYIQKYFETIPDHQQQYCCLILFNDIEFIYMEQDTLGSLAYKDIGECLKNKKVLAYFYNNNNTNTKDMSKKLKREGYICSDGLLSTNNKNRDVYMKCCNSKELFRVINVLNYNTMTTDNNDIDFSENKENVSDGTTTNTCTDNSLNISTTCSMTCYYLSKIDNAQMDKLPLFVSDYYSTLNTSTKFNTDVIVVNGNVNMLSKLLKLNTTPLENPKVLFYQLSYTDKDFDHDPWETGEVTLDSLYKDKEDEIRTLMSLGFSDMNHIFQYQTSIIFMKAAEKEKTRFIIDYYLNSAKLIGTFTPSLDNMQVVLRGRMYPSYEDNIERVYNLNNKQT